MDDFKNPKQLTLWTKSVLILFVVVSIISISIRGLYANHLANMKAGYETSEIHIMKDKKELLGKFVDIVRTLNSTLFIFTSTLVLWWIYRAAYNLKKLGANVTTTPIKSIVWYFVPIVHFWLPLLSMIQIWKASKNPPNWQLEKTSPLLFLWWFFWLATLFITYFSPLLPPSGIQSAKFLLDMEKYFMISQITWVLATIVLIILISKISKMQINAYAKSVK